MHTCIPSLHLANVLFPFSIRVHRTVIASQPVELVGQCLTHVEIQPQKEISAMPAVQYIELATWHMLPLDIQYMLLPCMLDGLARPCFRAAPWSHPFLETHVHTSAFLVHSTMMHAKDAGKASRTHAATCQYTFKSSCPLVAHEVISRSLWQTREFLNYCNDILHISELSITCLLTALAHTLQQHTQSSGVASAALLSDPLSMCCCPSLSFSCPPFVIISGSFAPCCLDSSMAHCSIPNSRMGHHNLLRSCRSTLQLPLLLQCSQVATSGGVLPLLPLLLLWLLLAPHLPRLCLCTQCLQITASNARIGCPL